MSHLTHVQDEQVVYDPCIENTVFLVQKNKGTDSMRQTTRRNISGLILFCGAALQLTLLITSMVTSFFFPPNYGMRPQWPSYLLAVLLLGITVVGFSRIRTSRETQRIDLPLGLTLGAASAILLFIPGLGITLFYAALGFPLLSGILIQDPAGLASVSPLLALISTALYVIFAAVYSVCAFRATRRSGSVKQGMQSSALAVMATFLSTTLLFSFLYATTSLFLHRANDLLAPSTFPGISPLVNDIASYQSVVQLTADWLLAPVTLGLLIALLTSWASRRTPPRPAIVVAE